MATASKRGSKTKRKRRTKGPSEKIRSLAAISLANKVGYLKLSDLVGQNSRAAEAAIDKLPKRNFKAGETVYPSSHKGPVACLVRSGRVNIVRTASTGKDFSVKAVEAGAIFGEPQPWAILAGAPNAGQAGMQACGAAGRVHRAGDSPGYRLRPAISRLPMPQVASAPGVRPLLGAAG